MHRDQQLRQSVLDELSWEPGVMAAHIGVTANAGVVTLTGHVENYAQKHAAETAAHRVKGVRAVLDEIGVRLPSDTRRSDDEIAAAAMERLSWDVCIPRDAIKVKVKEAWITLTGQVPWSYQREAAEQDVRRLFGVVGVSNRTMIKPRVDVSNISDEIMHALHRSWYFDPRTVTVSAEGGRVRLTGIVHSPHDRQVAAEAAWAAPGTTHVENDIAIA